MKHTKIIGKDEIMDPVIIPFQDNINYDDIMEIAKEKEINNDYIVGWNEEVFIRKYTV
jgi:hypothetical protein